MEDLIYPREVIGYTFLGCPLPKVQGAQKTGSQDPYRPSCAFLGNVIKQKLDDTPERGGTGQVRFQTSPRCPAEGPSSREVSAAMVPWPSELKLGR